MNLEARRWRLAAPATALACWAAPPLARATKDAAPPAARVEPDVSRLPAPGTYKLPRLFAAPDGEVLGPDGRRLRLAQVLARAQPATGSLPGYWHLPWPVWRVLLMVQVAL